MDVTVGIWRSVVQNKTLPPVASCSDFIVQPHIFPGFQLRRFAVGQVRLHGKFRNRQIERLFVVHLASEIW